MNLIQFLRILWARRWMVLLPALVALVIGLVISALLPARYPATARLMLDTIRPDPVTGIGVGGLEATTYLRTQLQLISDDRVIGGAIDRLGLANDPATQARFAESGFSDADGGIRRWLINQIRPRVSGGAITSSAILELKYEGQTPELAKAVVGAVRDSYIAETLRLKVDAANRTSAWYREQADLTARELAALEARRAAFMAENGIVLVGGPGSPDMEAAKLQTLQQAFSQAQSAVSTQQVAASAGAAVNSLADQLRVQLSAIDEEIARASEQLGPQHPSYRAGLARRKVVQQELANAIRQQGAASSAIVGASQAALARIEAQIQAQEQVVQRRKPLLDQLAVLDQDIEVLRKNYQDQTARGNLLGLESRVQETSFVILGDPVAESTPSYPKRGLIGGLSFLAGLGLGLLAALFLEFSARRVRGVEDLSYATGAPVLSHIGRRSRTSARTGLQRLLGRRRRDEDAEGGELQAI